MRGRWWGVLLALACVFATLPAVQPAAVAGTRSGYHWKLALKPVAVTIDGQRYRFRVIVGGGRECEDGSCDPAESVQVVGTSRHRSDVASAVQRNFFRFDFPFTERHFRHRADLSSASVRGTSDEGGRLAIDLRFRSDGPSSSSCDGHTRTRPGLITGSLRFRPVNSRIGTMTTLARRATLTYADGTCSLQPFLRAAYPKRPCQPGTVFIIGASSPHDRDLNVIARRDPDAATATIYVKADEESSYSVHYSLYATVPANHVQVSPDLSSTLVRGAKGSALSGQATSHAEDPSDDQPIPWPFPFDCESAGAGATVKHSLGPFHGDFSPDFWAGHPRGTDTSTVGTAA